MENVIANTKSTKADDIADGSTGIEVTGDEGSGENNDGTKTRKLNDGGSTRAAR